MTASFIVTSMEHRFKFTPEDSGYSVSELGVKGVNTQGDTFEEALTNALDASRVMAEFREELAVDAVMAIFKAACTARPLSRPPVPRARQVIPAIPPPR